MELFLEAQSMHHVTMGMIIMWMMMMMIMTMRKGRKHKVNALMMIKNDV